MQVQRKHGANSKIIIIVFRQLVRVCDNIFGTGHLLYPYMYHWIIYCNLRYHYCKKI